MGQNPRTKIGLGIKNDKFMNSADETQKRCAWDISYMKKYFIRAEGLIPRRLRRNEGD